MLYLINQGTSPAVTVAHNSPNGVDAFSMWDSNRTVAFASDGQEIQSTVVFYTHEVSQTDLADAMDAESAAAESAESAAAESAEDEHRPERAAAKAKQSIKATFRSELNLITNYFPAAIPGI